MVFVLRVGDIINVTNENSVAQGMIVNAGVLFGIAKEAYERTRAASSDNEPGHRDAIVAIIFSVAALEAFINEAVELSHNPPLVKVWKMPGQVTKFAEYAKEKNDTRMNIRKQFKNAQKILHGVDYDETKIPYKNFALLIELRNELVHMKPKDIFETKSDGNISMKSVPVIKRLDKNIVVKIKNQRPVPWISSICTRGVARWACNTASEMVQSILGPIPHNEYQSRLRQLYWLDFKLLQ